MEPQESDRDHFDDLGTRFVSAAALACWRFVCVWTGGIAFTGFVLLAALIMMKEWDALTASQMLSLRLADTPMLYCPAPA